MSNDDDRARGHLAELTPAQLGKAGGSWSDLVDDGPNPNERPR